MAFLHSVDANRLMDIENNNVVAGTVDVNGNLILTTNDGKKIIAGNVRGKDATVANASQSSYGIVRIADSKEVSAGNTAVAALTPYYYTSHANQIVNTKLDAYIDTQNKMYSLLEIREVIGDMYSGYLTVSASELESLKVKYIRAKIVGSGGQGGGCVNTVAAGQHAAAGGGGSGAFVDLWFPVSALGGQYLYLNAYGESKNILDWGDPGRNGDSAWIKVGDRQIATAGGGYGGSVGVSTALIVAVNGGAGGSKIIDSGWSQYVVQACDGSVGSYGYGVGTLGIGGNGGGIGGGRGAYGGGGSTSYDGGAGWGLGGGGGGSSANAGATRYPVGGPGAPGWCYVELWV